MGLVYQNMVLVPSVNYFIVCCLKLVDLKLGLAGPFFESKLGPVSRHYIIYILLSINQQRRTKQPALLAGLVSYVIAHGSNPHSLQCLSSIRSN